MRDEDAKIPVEGAIERVDAARARVAIAARALPADVFAQSGRGILSEHVANVQRISQQVLYVALSGELPPEEESPSLPGDRDGLLGKLEETLDSLYVHVREADPDEFADFVWGDPAKGELNWRGWLISLEAECDGCARALEGLLNG